MNYILHTMIAGVLFPTAVPLLSASPQQATCDQAVAPCPIGVNIEALSRGSWYIVQILETKGESYKICWTMGSPTAPDQREEWVDRKFPPPIAVAATQEKGRQSGERAGKGNCVEFVGSVQSGGALDKQAANYNLNPANGLAEIHLSNEQRSRAVIDCVGPKR